MTTLRQRMIEDLKVRNRSPRTIQSYLAHVANVARYWVGLPNCSGRKRFVSAKYIWLSNGTSPGVLSTRRCALRFLYRHTLDRDAVVAHIPFPRQPKKLPVVMSQAEVNRFLDAIKKPKFRGHCQLNSRRNRMSGLNDRTHVLPLG